MEYDEDDSARRAKQAAFLRALEDIALEAPWKFGYSDIMYKETKFSGLEAQYSAIKTVFWFDDLDILGAIFLKSWKKFAMVKKNEFFSLNPIIPLPHDHWHQIFRNFLRQPHQNGIGIFCQNESFFEVWSFGKP